MAIPGLTIIGETINDSVPSTKKSSTRAISTVCWNSRECKTRKGPPIST